MRKIISIAMIAALLLTQLTSCGQYANATTVATTSFETEESTMATWETIDISVYDEDFLSELRQYLSEDMIQEGYTLIDFPDEGSYAKYTTYKGVWYRDQPLEQSIDKASYKAYDRELTWEDFDFVYRGMTAKELVESVGLPSGQILGRAYYALSDGSFAVVLTQMDGTILYKNIIKWGNIGSDPIIFDVIHVDQQGNAFRRGLSTENFFSLDTVDSEEYVTIKIPTEKANGESKKHLGKRKYFFSLYATYKSTQRQYTCNDLMAVLEKDMPANEIVSLLGEPNGLVEIFAFEFGLWHPYYLLDNGTYAILEIAYPEWHVAQNMSYWYWGGEIWNVMFCTIWFCYYQMEIFIILLK